MKFIGISILVVFVFFGAAYLLTGGSSQTPETADNVSVVDGIQIVEISAKGGYRPGRSIAKAGIPTVIRFNTSGTFDCSSSVRIPSLGISKMLPQTGSTDIDIGSPGASILKGSCGMGMYRFEVSFQNG